MRAEAPKTGEGQEALATLAFEIDQMEETRHFELQEPATISNEFVLDFTQNDRAHFQIESKIFTPLARSPVFVDGLFLLSHLRDIPTIVQTANVGR